MAERGGFELPEPVKAHSLSRRAQSTTLPPLRFVVTYLSDCGKQSECQMSVPLEAPHHADGFSPLGTGLNNFRHSLRITHCRLARRMQRRHCPGASWSNLFTDFPRRCTRKPHSFARGFARPCLFCQFRRVIVEDILLAAMARCVVVRLSRRS